jgi:hypothetical protein
MKHLLPAVLAVISVILPSVSGAQSMSGVSIGDDRRQLESLGSKPVASEAMGPHSLEKYKLSGGNDLSVTYRRGSGTIVYVETDWGGQTAGAFSDFEGFKFGTTTLSQIRSKLRSNGISFRSRPPVSVTPEGGLVLFNSYEVEGADTIVTFVTSISPKIVKSAKESGSNPDVGQIATLEAMIIGQKDYLDTIWGSDKTMSPGYAPIAWPAEESSKSQLLPTDAAAEKLKPSDFPVQRVYRGKPAKADFSGENAHFRDFRTRIRQGMATGPNFAGEYSVIQFGCGTGCSSVIVANNRSGRPYTFPRGGEDNMYLALKYKLDSRLMIAQWGSYESGKCYMEYFDFTDGGWREISKREVGPLDDCYREIDENTR